MSAPRFPSSSVPSSFALWQNIFSRYLGKTRGEAMGTSLRAVCTERIIMLFNEPSWIKLEPRNHDVFDTLVSFVDSVSADPTNVQRLADSTINNIAFNATRDPSVEQYRTESRFFFGILFTIIAQLDADAVQQDYLVKLVLSIRRLPLPASVRQAIDPRDMDANMNHDLSKLINVFADFEHDAPLHPRPEDRASARYVKPERSVWRQPTGQHLTADAWTSVDAFVARVHTAAPDVRTLDLRGLFAMIEALEQPLSPTRLEDVLPTAAAWIVYAGDALKGNDIPYADLKDDMGTKRFPGSRGELWTGPHALNKARWEFWMEMFKTIAERGDVDEGVRVAALRALEAGSR